MKNKDYPIEKKLRYKLYITLALYVVIGFVLTLLLGYIFTLSKNPVIACQPCQVGLYLRLIPL